VDPVEILVFYNKLSWFVSELHEKDLYNVGSSVGSGVVQNKLSWFVSEIPEKGILNVWV
jgi:hypothetical protein